MNPERWQQIEQVLQGALDCPVSERPSYLEEVCSGDLALRREVESLVDAYAQADDFIEEPAITRDAAVLAHDLPDSYLGKMIGAYRIIEQLGSGGMGEVYLAEDSRLPRLVALKILPAYLVADESRLRRFQREARAVSALNHPNVLTIYEVGESAGVNFIATEFIDGETIRTLISRQSLSLEEILDISLQVAAGLVAAHDAGIVHRDVKPENIMRRSDGVVKVLDFGIAKPLDQQPGVGLQTQQTETGIVMGTVGYMSPEQARGYTVDGRTDIWSFGVVLYEMLSGRAPFVGATRVDTLVSILEREPHVLFQLSPDLPDQFLRLQKVLDQALAKDADDRYQTIAAMTGELRNLKQEFELTELLKTHSAQTSFAAGLDKVGTSRQTVETLRLNRQLSSAPITGLRNHKFLVLGVAAILVLLTTLWIALYPRRPDTANTSSNASAVSSKLYRDMTEAERMTFVEAQEQRISSLMGDRPVKLNEEAVTAIKSKVDFYSTRLGSTSTEAGQENLETIYGRATTFVPLIARSFEARKVPAMIGIYLPMIESEYRPCFENAIGAKGLFQFMPQTAKQYGVSPEEMCDEEKMAPAAADYIADRMAELGEDSQSMTLVLLSYNRGSTWVRDALIQLRTTENFERNFWTLFTNRKKLGNNFQEGTGYVPMFFAAAIVGENPKNFGLQTPPLTSLAAK